MQDFEGVVGHTADCNTEEFFNATHPLYLVACCACSTRSFLLPRHSVIYHTAFPKMSVTLDFSTGASIISIADTALERGSQVVTFLGQVSGSEQTVARLQAEVRPLDEIIRRLKDKLESSSGSDMPFRNEIGLACWNAQRILEELQKYFQSWEGQDGTHSIGSSLKVAFSHEKVEAILAQLGNWRSMIKLAMAASIL